MDRHVVMVRALRRTLGGRSVRVAGAVFATAAISAGVAAASTTHAHAYGTTHLYEITISENCVNPKACVQSAQNPFGIGGIWGWIEPDAGGSADAQVTFQGHSNADPSLNGTTQLPSSWSWTIAALPTPSPFISPPDPNGNYFVFTIPSFPGFTFLTPATPGHYHTALGPGIDANVNVTQLH